MCIAFKIGLDYLPYIVQNWAKFPHLACSVQPFVYSILLARQAGAYGTIHQLRACVAGTQDFHRLQNQKFIINRCTEINKEQSAVLSNVAALKVLSLDLQQQLGTCQKCIFSGLTPGLWIQNLWNKAQHSVLSSPGYPDECSSLRFKDERQSLQTAHHDK